MEFTRRQEEVANQLRMIGAFKDKRSSPDGKGFRLKLHERDPTAPLSPIYVDLRVLRNFPEERRGVADVMGDLIKGLRFNHVGDIPHAVSPIVAVMADQRGWSQLTTRTEAKGYGTGGVVVGVFRKNDTVVVCDDVITEADSKLKAIKTLEAEGLFVADVAVIVDREQGGREKLREAGYNLHSVFTLSGLIEHYARSGAIPDELYMDIREYFARQSDEAGARIAQQ